MRYCKHDRKSGKEDRRIKEQIEKEEGKLKGNGAKKILSCHTIEFVQLGPPGGGGDREF